MAIMHHVFHIDLFRLLPNRSLCLFHNVTHLPCPGCGMTRAFVSLGQLHIIQALSYNPFCIPLLILMLLFVCTPQIPRRTWIQKHHLDWIALAVVMLFWGTRLLYALV
jgi:hypothetical protein